MTKIPLPLSFLNSSSRLSLSPFPSLLLLSHRGNNGNNSESERGRIKEKQNWKEKKNEGATMRQVIATITGSPKRVKGGMQTKRGWLPSIVGVIVTLLMLSLVLLQRLCKVTILGTVLAAHLACINGLVYHCQHRSFFVIDIVSSLTFPSFSFSIIKGSSTIADNVALFDLFFCIATPFLHCCLCLPPAHYDNLFSCASFSISTHHLYRS